MQTLQQQPMLSTLLRAPTATTENAEADDMTPVTPMTPQTEWPTGGAVDRYTERMMQYCIDCFSAAGMLLHRVLQGRTGGESDDDGDGEAGCKVSAKVSAPGEGVEKVLLATTRTRVRKVARKNGTQNYTKNKTRKNVDAKESSFDRKFNFGCDLMMLLPENHSYASLAQRTTV